MKTDIRRRSAARVGMLKQIKDVTDQEARAMRRIWLESLDRYGVAAMLHPAYRDKYLSRVAVDPTHFKKVAIDLILGTHGLERYEGKRESFWYCNAGDLYAPTVIFRGKAMRVGCVADFAEGERAPRPF